MNSTTSGFLRSTGLGLVAWKYQGHCAIDVFNLTRGGRQKRIAEIQTAAKRPRFGSVEDIRGSEFIQKVTNAGPDIYVVVRQI